MKSPSPHDNGFIPLNSGFIILKMPYSPRLTKIISANRIKKEGLALYIVFLIMAAVFLPVKMSSLYETRLGDQ